MPLFNKLPPKFTAKLLVASDAELLLMLTGALITFAPFKVTGPAVLAIITPAADPVAGNIAGNSSPVVWAAVPLYFSVAELVYVKVPLTTAVAAPSIESVPPIVVVPAGNVFMPDPVSVTLL